MLLKILQLELTDEIDFKKIDKCLEIVNLKKNLYLEKHKATIGEVEKNSQGGYKEFMIGQYIKMVKYLSLTKLPALDAKNENSILKKIKKISSNKILIIVSHKQKLINSCDYKIKI